MCCPTSGQLFQQILSLSSMLNVMFGFAQISILFLWMKLSERILKLAPWDTINEAWTYDWNVVKRESDVPNNCRMSSFPMKSNALRTLSLSTIKSATPHLVNSVTHSSITASVHAPSSFSKFSARSHQPPTKEQVVSSWSMESDDHAAHLDHPDWMRILW